MAELTAAEIAKQDKVSGRAWGILAVTYLASICAPLCQFKIPPLASWLFPAFHGELDPVTFGLLMSALYQVVGWNEAGMLLQLPCYALGLILCFFILPRGKNVKTMDDVPAEKAWPRGF